MGAGGEQSAERPCTTADFDDVCAADLILGNASSCDGAADRLGYEKVLTKPSFRSKSGIAQYDSRIMPALARALPCWARRVRRFALQRLAFFHSAADRVKYVRI
jgi:hypothetical protein